MFWHFISHLPVKRGGSLSFLVIFTFAVPELLDLIWRKIGFLPFVLFASKLLIKFQNILRNITQVIIRHRLKILFSVISSPITLKWQKWKSSKMKGSRVIGLDMTENRMFTLCRMITWILFLRMFSADKSLKHSEKHYSSYLTT
jgi:hypothetical protein